MRLFLGVTLYVGAVAYVLYLVHEVFKLLA